MFTKRVLVILYQGIQTQGNYNYVSVHNVYTCMLEYMKNTGKYNNTCTCTCRLRDAPKPNLEVTAGTNKPELTTRSQKSETYYMSLNYSN